MDPSEESYRRAEGSLGHSFTIGVLEVDLLLPLCRSLKDKRGIVKRTVAHLRKHHPVSVAEVAQHDTWGRAGLAAVSVSGDRATVEGILRAAARMLERDRDVQVVAYSIELI